MPRRCSSTFWAGSGAVTHRSRIVLSGLPGLLTVGRITSPLLIFANSSSTVRGASPSPDRCIQPANVFQST